MYIVDWLSTRLRLEMLCRRLHCGLFKPPRPNLSLFCMELKSSPLCASGHVYHIHILSLIQVPFDKDLDDIIEYFPLLIYISLQILLSNNKIVYVSVKLVH